MIDRIRWAGKIKQAKIRQLYWTDARGIIDQDLIDEVGIALYSRCHSVILVSNRQVECPRCRSIVQITLGQTEDRPFTCATEGCGWETTYQEWHSSWPHQNLIGSRAISAFESYVQQYPRARTPQKKMLLINQLLHAFHHGNQAGVPHRSVANNLIQGNHEQVVAFLDELTYGQDTTPGLEARHAAWQRDVQKMWQFRRASRGKAET